MIVKDHHKQNELLRLDALNSRLLGNHPLKEIVQIDVKKKVSEVSGEKAVDYPLGFLDNERYLILHNLRLVDPNGYFQIDTLIISESFLLIVEVKNWQGTVIFGENGQVIRKKDDIEEGFPNPIPQAKTQAFRLQKWIRQFGEFQIPIDFLVVIAYPSTIIRTSHPGIEIPKQVIHSNELHLRIQSLEKKYTDQFIGLDSLLKLSTKMKQLHVPTTDDLLSKYQIDRNDLIKGVFCPQCATIRMSRRKQKWYCVTCHFYSVDAHLVALRDYMLLLGNYITNKQLREFLLIDSPYIAKYLLQKENYQYTGTSRGRVYIMK